MYYCKEIKHGPRAAFSEHVATLLNALTGQPTPLTRVGGISGQAPTYLLSKRIPGYRDIGELLLDKEWMAKVTERDGLGRNEASHGEPGEKLEREFEQAYRALAQIRELENAGVPKQSREKKAPRRELYEARSRLLDLLPNDIRQMLGKAQFISRMVGHNDFANGEFCNVGLNDANVVVALDFGNALHQGFGGRQRGRENFEAARSLAYPENDPYPASTMLKPEDHRLGGDPRFTRNTGTNVGGIPRSGPVAELVRDAIHAESRLAEVGAKGDVLAEEMYFLGGQLEAAFQLGLVPDDAIKRVVAREWPGPDDPVAPYKDDDTIRDSADELAARITRERRKLVDRFRPDDLQRWREKYPGRARDSYNQVAAAVAALTGIYIPPYSPADTRRRLRPGGSSNALAGIRRPASS